MGNSRFAPNKGKPVGAIFKPARLGTVSFASSASGSRAPVPQSVCATEIFGIPAIRLETADLADPIEVGKEVTYEIKVTNQGTLTGTNIRFICALPAGEEFVSSTGATRAQGQDRTVTMETLAALEPKAVASWQVVVKALHADDARFKVEVAGAQFEKPIRKDAATQLY